MIELLIAKDGQEVNRYFLPQGITTLGRADDNEIILDDVCVSRRHAQIRVEGANVLIEDLGSGNGTFCGDTRIARKELTHGDEIVIEPFHITLSKQGDADAPSRTPAKTQPPREMPEVSMPDSLAEPTSNRSTDGGAANPMLGPHLETVRGTGGQYALEDGEMRIGRSEDQDVVLKDASASRGHAIIAVRNGRFMLRDNGSANGTFVNGKQVSEHSLRPGDVILIGNTELAFVDPDSDRPTTTRTHGTPAPTGASGGMEMEMPMFEDASTNPPMPGNTAGGMVGGALPAEEPGYEGTIPGGPPPAIDPHAADLGMPPVGGGIPPTDPGMMPPGTGGGLAPLNYNDGGMEMGFGGNDYYPQAGPANDSLAAKLIWNFKNNPRFRLMAIVGGIVFVAILFIGAVSQGPSGPTTQELTGIQKQYMDSAKQQYRDAEQAMQSKKYSKAIDYYEKTYRTTDKAELAGIRTAEALQLQAQRQVLILHEVMVINMIGATINKKEDFIQGTKKEIAAAKSAMNSAYKRAARSGTLTNWQRVVTTSSKYLRYKPRDETAKNWRDEGRKNVSRIVGNQSQAQKDKIVRNAKSIFDRGMREKRSGDAASLNKAIKTLGRVKNADPTNVAGLNSRVQAEVAAIKRSLSRAAATRVEQGRAEVARRDWIRAREALLVAVRIDPYNKEANRLLATVENECTKSAAESFKKAQVFESINNYSDARDQCKRAKRYHPNRNDQFQIKCNELMKRLDRKQEGLR